ncbi:hypothetical protein EJ03DRAFT_215309 [Teratosphaeria nubilosa]|uniref:Uncharacterized protein n=1 Tax=Teratosphaeria nubilosa TaxID=161662 RepID=A0A6G1LJ59_9PEZI|nr:hypothetical protein EJ03DRAFT_215309 [Teratosphaeria nubilosa]
MARFARTTTPFLSHACITRGFCANAPPGWPFSSIAPSGKHCGQSPPIISRRPQRQFQEHWPQGLPEQIMPARPRSALQSHASRLLRDSPAPRNQSSSTLVAVDEYAASLAARGCRLLSVGILRVAM